MQEVNATLDTIVVTDAESNTGEGTTAIEPYHYTIYFDIGPSSGCSPIIKTRGSGPAVGKIGAVLFALFVLLLGGFVMRRRETGA
jgi:glucose-6-phosphate dehydrogenase assembly protein OpcA